MPQNPAPATATSGHFTKPLPLENTYTSDPALQRILQWYMPKHVNQLTTHLTKLGDEAVSEKVSEWSADAERNQPYVKGYNVWGERYPVDKLVTSEGWKRLRAWGVENGVVALGYEDTYGTQRRTAQYAVNYIFSPSSGITSCPISMTDGAALILSQEIQRRNLPPSHAFCTTLAHLVSRDSKDAWTSGQWMTERVGGSDVQGTETWAAHSPLPETGTGTKGVDGGEYLINGFKFFSSATDADVSLLLAKTSPRGNLSTFLAPLQTTTGNGNNSSKKTNGIRIHRLKNKLGTKELPTAELELVNTRAHLVGEIDKGVQSIGPLLNITRAHTFIGSLGGWRRALSIAKSFAKTRTTVGEELWRIPMHLRLLADLEGRHRACMELGFFTVAVMDVVENGTANPDLTHLPKPGKEANVVFRTLTALSKAVISKMAIAGIQECQEALGGVGYMDEPDEPEFNISRILRSVLVNSIWEGTTNVLASECVRWLLRGDTLDVFGGWVERVLGGVQGPLSETWKRFRERLASMDKGLALADARRAMFTLAWILSGMLLAVDAARDGDAVTGEIARRWVSGELGVGDMVWRDIIPQDSQTSETTRWDGMIAWGEEVQVASGHRSLKL
ncbi:hypothetical protein BDV18DRAFT_43689 [Aspergillus unguis]